MKKNLAFVVDDKSEVVSSLVALLSENNFDVIEARNGVEGIEMLENFKGRPPNIIITDDNMPKLRGVHLVRALKELSRYKDVPIILHTQKQNYKCMMFLKNGCKDIANMEFQPVSQKKDLSKAIVEKAKELVEGYTKL